MKSLSNVGAERLGDALGESIDDGAKLSIISSYFTVFAYGELKEELSKVDEVRFLFSEPTFIKRMADSKEPREFEVARRAREVGVGGSGLELTLRNNLNQRALARECAEWIREKGVFKSAKTSGAIQPGGTYVVENPSGDDHAFMGAAANFTQEGLGYERRPGTVTCVSHFENATEAVGLKMMFECGLGQPCHGRGGHRAGGRPGRDALPREPARVHLFPDPVPPVPRLHGGRRGQRHPAPASSFEESVVWSKLYDFQKDAVVGAIRKLEKYKGCIIADSVGLGKTYEALAVMKYYQERNDRILVLCAEAPAGQLDPVDAGQRRPQPAGRRPLQLHGAQPHRPVALPRHERRGGPRAPALGPLRPPRHRREPQLQEQEHRRGQDRPLHAPHRGRHQDRASARRCSCSLPPR